MPDCSIASFATTHDSCVTRSNMPVADGSKSLGKGSVIVPAHGRSTLMGRSPWKGVMPEEQVIAFIN